MHVRLKLLLNLGTVSYLSPLCLLALVLVLVVVVVVVVVVSRCW